MKNPKIGVIGLGGQSAFMSTEHFPAPGETITCQSLFFELGGKGYNQAVACARMGVDTVFIGAVGQDDNGKACEKDLIEKGIVPCLVQKDIPTAFAVITTDHSGENTVSVFPGAAKALAPEDLRSDGVMAQLKECSHLLLQNELSPECLEEACRIGQELKIPVVFNPAPAENIPPELLKCCNWITPNYGEAKHLTGYLPEEQPTGRELMARFAKMGVCNAIITMGGAGSLIMTQGEFFEVPALSCKPVDTTGAGDTFNGIFTAMLTTGKTVLEAASLASVGAGISVTRHGATGSIPVRAEVENRYQKEMRENQ